jgi:HEAT repeat protein
MPSSSDDRTVSQLIAVALTGEADDVQAWEAVCRLRERGDQETWDAASLLMRSSQAKERGRGVDILTRFGAGESSPRSPELQALCADQLLECLRGEHDEEVLGAIASGLAHLHDAGAVPALLRFAVHGSAAVRLGVVMGLNGQDAPEAVDGLIALSADVSEEVRNWATFGLGSMSDADGPRVRGALEARLTDPVDEVRGEALVGLARRRAPRVAEVLRRELDRRPVLLLAVEAAEALGDGTLLPALEALRGSLEGDAHLGRVLEHAIGQLRRTLQ